MKNTNRIFSIVFAVIFVFVGTVSTPFAQSDDQVAPSQYHQAIELVTALDIMIPNQDGEFLWKDSVTRAEFALILTHMLGYGDITSGTAGRVGARNNEGGDDQWMGSGLGTVSTAQVQVPDYVDVPFDYEGYGAINLVSALNLMGGSDGYFRPDELISYQQAMAVMVRVLGMGVLAESRGGYPMGYNLVANERKIAVGIEPTGEDAPINRGALAQLIANCLEIDVVSMSGFGPGAKYQFHTGKTILGERLKIAKSTGMITGNENTGLYSVETRAPKGYISQGAQIFKLGKLSASDLLGRRVSLYYSIAEDNENQVLHIYERERDNVRIDGDMRDFSEYKNEQFYLDDGVKRRESFAVAAGVPVIFNSVYYDIASSLDFDHLRENYSSSFSLIDSNGDGEIDVIFVDSYQSYYVRSVNSTQLRVFVTDIQDGKGMMISPNTASYLPLDFDEDNTKYVYYRNGVEASFDSIRADVIISLAESRNIEGERLVHVHISNNKVNGQVMRLEEQSIMINDEAYEITPNAAFDIRLAVTGTFYLDVAGKIAFCTYAGTDYDYAYIIEGDYKKGVGNTLQVKMFTKKENKVNIFETAQSITLQDENSNGRYISMQVSPRVLAEKLQTPQTEKLFGDLFVAYKLNEEGKIREIVMPRVHTTWVDSTDPSFDAMNYTVERHEMGILSTYTNADKTDGPGVKEENRYYDRVNFYEFIPEKNCMIFDLSSPDTNRWTMRSGHGYFQNGHRYSSTAYNLTYGYTAEIVLLNPPENYSDGSSFEIGSDISSGEAVTIITKLSSVIDEDGKEYTQITGLRENKEVTYWINPWEGREQVDQMDIGDWWIFRHDNGVVSHCKQVFDFREQDLDNFYGKKTRVIDNENEHSVGWGIVKEFYDDSLMVAFNENPIDSNRKLWLVRINQWGAGTSFTSIYDVKNKTIEVTSSTMIAPNDIIVESDRWRNVVCIMIIRNWK